MLILSSFLNMFILAPSSNGRSILRRQKDRISTSDTIQADGTLLEIGQSAHKCPSTRSVDTDPEQFFEPKLPTWQQICPRMGGCYSSQHKSARRPAYLDEDGTQVPLWKLEASVQDQVWTAAGVAGAALRKTMDQYVSRGVSRGGPSQDAKLEANYRESMAARYEHYPKVAGVTNNRLALRAMGLEALLDTDFTSVSWGDKSVGLPILSLAGSPTARMIVTEYAYSDCDSTPRAQRAFSSTLTWRAWSTLAPQTYKNLKYHMMYHIDNQASVNIMSLAHRNYPGGVTLPPQTSIGRARNVLEGHGLFRPDDPGYNELLAAPNLNVMVQMIADYNNEMENPYIVAIHTFPAVSENSVPEASSSERRHATIIVEHGPAPSTVKQPRVQGTIDTEKR